MYICVHIHLYVHTYIYFCDAAHAVCQSIKGPHKATHGQGEATSQHSHRGQHTLRHQVLQAWGAIYAVSIHLDLAIDIYVIDI